MSPTSINGYYADQGEPQAYGKSKQFSTKPNSLAFLSAYNKGVATVYIELFDTADGTDLTGLVPEILPCPTKTLVYWSQLRMRNGCFVRAVDADTGGSLIAGSDVRFSARFMDNAA
jgi:hypothetical protein